MDLLRRRIGMENDTNNEINATIDPEDEAMMVKYGITRVPINYYHYKGYRYTNQNDALAEIERQQPKSDAIMEGRHKNKGKMIDSEIIRVPVNNFCYKDYRYTNLKDAIAQALHEKE
jgi:hypothetical protein